MTIYYIEKTSKGFNLHEVEHNKRHLFWVQHPHAKEISKQQFISFVTEAKRQADAETNNQTTQPVKAEKTNRVNRKYHFFNWPWLKRLLDRINAGLR